MTPAWLAIGLAVGFLVGYEWHRRASYPATSDTAVSRFVSAAPPELANAASVAAWSVHWAQYHLLRDLIGFMQGHYADFAADAEDAYLRSSGVGGERHSELERQEEVYASGSAPPPLVLPFELRIRVLERLAAGLTRLHQGQPRGGTQ